MDVSKRGIYTGGHTNSLMRLVEGLESNHEILIVVGSSRKNFQYHKNLHFQPARIVPICVYSPRSSAFYALEYITKALHRLIELRRTGVTFDTIHGHSGYPHYAVLTALAGMVFKAHSVQTLYCAITNEVVDSHNPVLNEKVAKYALSKLDRIIAISRNIASSLESIGILPSRISVIPPPIDAKSHNPRRTGLSIRSKIGREGQIILSVGNLTRTKGLHVLIESLPLILREYPNAKLVYTLDIEMKSSPYEERRRKDIHDKIRKLGIQNNVLELGIVENMPELMAASDVFVAPFLSTAGPSDYPVPVLEAMAIGKTVIATSVGGINEIIESGKTGILVGPNDIAELARAIVETIGDSNLRSEMGKNASAFVSEHCSLETVVSKTEEVYLGN